VASRLLQQAASSKASQGLQTAQTISRALLHSGFSTAAGPSAAAQAGSRHQWAVALAACLGAGLHLYSSSNNDAAQCRAANASGEGATLGKFLLRPRHVQLSVAPWPLLLNALLHFVGDGRGLC
jgi:hypothetical protein